MKTNFAIIAITGLALVAGCNRGATNSSANKANSSMSNNSAAAAPAAAPAATGAPVTQASVVGTWGQDNCTNTMTLAADGTATSTTSKLANTRWSVDGSTIVITSPGQPDTRMPATISDKGLLISGGGGEGVSALMAPCPTPAGAASEAGTETDAAEEPAEAAE